MKFLPIPGLIVLLGAFTFGGCTPSDHEKGDAKEAKAETHDEADDSSSDKPFQIGFKCLSQRVPVIMYHDIVERRGRGTVWFDCTVAEFTDQMEKIRSGGYHPVSLDDLHDHLTTGKPLPDKAIVLTFDDNYQGFYDHAWPLLKAAGFPAAIYVHTGYVGAKTGRAHMSWNTLSALSKNPLITIGSHTVSHPDLTTLTPDKVEDELTKSKKDLEDHLGRKIEYFAYPDGKNNPDDQKAAQDAGYTMSVSIANGPAEESPNIECVNRYIQTRFQKALDECDESMRGAVGVYEGEAKSAPVSYEEKMIYSKAIAIVAGGTPTTLTSSTRESVLDFMHRSSAVAGINGTFFDMASIESTDNKLVGPCLTGDESTLLPDNESYRWPKIRNRPLIMWGPTKAAIVPYSPPLMNDPDAYKQFMPDMTDLFLAGAWLVHQGVPRDKKDLLICSSKDVEDPRRRAAFGYLKDGRPFAAAAKDSVPSSTFARMLSQADVQEAVLLDSGFSTSLVYGEKIMASGHSTKTEASRPVPHAIVFKGELDPASQAAANAAVPATDPVAGSSTTPHRRRRRFHHRSHPATSSTSPPAPGPGLP